MKLTCVGRSFFTPEMPSQISGGAEVWLGYYQSLRATQAGLTLNVDMSAMAFVRSMPMVREGARMGGVVCFRKRQMTKQVKLHKRAYEQYMRTNYLRFRKRGVLAGEKRGITGHKFWIDLCRWFYIP